MSNLRFLRTLLFGIGCVLMLAAVFVPASAQIVVKNEDVTFKFGIQGQLWADWTQDSSGTQGYQQNFYLRRARIIFAGDVGKNISFFFETDDPKLGITPKNLASGFIIQDALMEWKPSDHFQVDGGLFIIPFSRNGLQSTLSYMTLDVSPISTVTNSTTQSSALRDMGFQFKGFFANDRLQYRLGAFDGERDANGHNSLRTAGYLQYDFFDREKGYLFTGTGLGKLKILAVDAGVDKQGSYRGYSANAAAAIPINKGDEVAGQFQYIHYDGRTKFTAIPDQNDFLLEAAYYVHQAKIQPFLKYETQAFVAAANASKDINRFGLGATYYIRGQNLKWTCQYLRAIPQNGSPLKSANEFTVQLQLMYF
ncbi:MAG: OprO/OprP family phosphate-selective porin [Acidobacteriia bacterium]|nr:OprO/OprP family phosphate-selective porin [Terriglobia bacterium]